MKVVRILFVAAGVLALAGCGAATATPSVSSSTPTPIDVAGAPTATPSVSSSTPTPIDVAGAQRAALGLFVADFPGHWVACSNSDNWAGCPLSAAVKVRLADLTSKGYFGDASGCGEEYISGTQNGFNNAPQVLSAVAGGSGSVTVVIQRSSSPNLTAVMTTENATWLASDLASGAGLAASIFSAKPNC